MSETTTYTVTGMTCEHCVRAVSTEVGAIAGVEQVTVDLPVGAVTITSAGPISMDDVRAAIDEAGYALVDA